MADPISTAASNAAAQAMKDVAANPTVTGAEQAIETAAETVASAALSGNPLESLAFNLFGHQVISGIVVGLFGLYSHIGAAVPQEMAAAKAWLDKHTGGVL